MQLLAQDTVTDLVTFEDYTLVKAFDFEPVKSVQDAVGRLNGDHEKLIALINSGLASEARNEAKKNADVWVVLPDGVTQAALDLTKAEKFTGVPGDSKKLNTTILTMAKSFFGFSKEQSKADKESARQSAIDMIKSNPVMLAGIQKTCARAANLEPDSE